MSHPRSVFILPVINNKKPKTVIGFTLVEIIVSLVILSMIMAGLANLFFAVKGYNILMGSKIKVGELCRYFSAPLRLDARADTWGNSPVGNPPPPAGTGNLISLDGNYRSSNIPLADFPQYAGYTVLGWLEEPALDGITYYPVYEVSTTYGNLRKVRLSINWKERAP